ncbi:hypothetical protein GCM10012285_27910 [Streptomyces kronopolitis]|uniref:Transposase n=1 Tax=Streptomyces kronopolitis TaxID=1612435 RepID=A0ABQ2JCN6_9ACTN|nr:hypothetical protein GCM10012285_27910 [Streptomyces kronopolitis]
MCSGGIEPLLPDRTRKRGGRRGPGHGDVTRLPDQWRGIATPYEKTATIYLAGLHIAGTFLLSAR